MFKRKFSELNVLFICKILSHYNLQYIIFCTLQIYNKYSVPKLVVTSFGKGKVAPKLGQECHDIIVFDYKPHQRWQEVTPLEVGAFKGFRNLAIYPIYHMIGY